MFVQTQTTPNPNSLKFIPGKIVSRASSFEVTNKDNTNNDLVRNILSINGVTSLLLGSDFISVNKKENIDWEDIKHIVITLINE
jgi:Scaffold protein Nfu/NifU N terminal.